MTTNYPASLDTTTQLKINATDSTITSVTHSTAHNNVSDALIAIETELGIDPAGAFTDVVARLADLVATNPGANQAIVSQGAAVIPLVLKIGGSQPTARMMDIQSVAGATIGFWNRAGEISGASVRTNNVLLASTHLADTANILLNPSPSITSPSISTPTLTGTPVAPTASVDTSTTQVATTAFVKNQGYIVPASPALTGVPTAPTPSVGDNTTKIATTAYVVAEIADTSTADVPVGMITAYGATSPPTGYLVCDGAAVSEATYAELFAEIAYTYGNPGGGNFNLPDLRGRAPVGLGTHADVDALADSDGAAVANRRPTHAHSQSLGTDSVGSHGHSLSGTSSAGGHTHSGTGTGGSSAPSGSDFTATQSAGVGTSGGGSHGHSNDTGGGGGHTHSASGTVGVAGISDKAGYVVVQYIIRALP